MRGLSNTDIVYAAAHKHCGNRSSLDRKSAALRSPRKNRAAHDLSQIGSISKTKTVFSFERVFWSTGPHLRHDAVPGQQGVRLVGTAAGRRAFRGRQDVGAAQVAGHDDDGVAEADRAAL
jgi:hypothetical protein